MRLPALASVLDKFPDNAYVHILIRDLNFIDHACLDLLVNWEEQQKAQGGDLVFDWEGLHSVFQPHVWGNNGKVQLF